MALQQREAKIETSIDQRRHRRHTLLLEVETHGSETASSKAIVHDISDTGLLIETQSILSIGEMIEVKLPHSAVMEAEIIWAGNHVYGCKFTQELSPAAISAARLGGHFTLTDGLAVNAVMGEAKDAIAAPDASTERLSLGRKLWFILGLSLSLWIILGAAAYWLVF